MPAGGGLPQAPWIYTAKRLPPLWRTAKIVRSTAEFLDQLPALGGLDLIRCEAGSNGHSFHHQVVNLRFGETLILIVDFHVV